jgi:mono/diheme cytochrome c family protein
MPPAPAPTVASPAEPPPAPVDGAESYARNCAACHQDDGQGVDGAFPPLVGETWVTGDPERPVGVVLNGLYGPIDVEGVAYDGAMAPFDHLSDAEIAAVVSHIRSSFGNDAEPVSAAFVAEVRAASKRP